MNKKATFYLVCLLLLAFFKNEKPLWAQATTYYTVNAALPTGGTNYQSFTDLTNDLNTNGINSPVVVNVVPGSGPYIDTIHFNYISGASPTNTIRINGNGETVKNIGYYPNGYYYNHILIMDSTKYLTVDSLVFKTNDSTYNNYNYGGNGAYITGWAEYDSITNCVFDYTRDSVWWYGNYANSGAITLGGTNYWYWYYGRIGGAKHCYIGNNLIVDSSSSYYNGNYYYSTYLGIGVFKGSENNIIEYNTINARNYYDIYLSGCKNNKIQYNDISQMNDSLYNYYYGYGHYSIYTLDTISGTQIIGNRIHDINAVFNQGYNNYDFWGMYLDGMGTASEPVLVANNAIYNIPYDGGIIGIEVNGWHQKIYNNTIAINKNVSSYRDDYGIKIPSITQGVELKNNNVSITAGGNGKKYGFYSFSLLSDLQKNNYYVNSTQSGAQYFGYYLVNYPTLASFQAGNPGLEVGSPVVDPQFEDPSIGNLSVNNMALKGQGVDLSAAVPMDILENPRPQLPTIGAFEAVLAKNDGAAFVFVTPTDSFCASSQPVSVVIYNAGVNDINNMTLHWTVNGVVQPVVNYNDTLHSIASTAGHFSDTVLLGSTFVGSSAPTEIKVWTAAPNGVADTVNTNDTIIKSFQAIPANFVVTPDFNLLCPAVPAHLNLSPDTGYTAGQLTWQYSDNGTNWIDIPNSDSTGYTDVNMNATKWYRVKIEFSETCYSDTAQVKVITPQVLATTPDGICDSGTVVLHANGSPSSALHWYNTASSSTVLGSGSSFATPPITSNHVYYVSAGINGLPACESSRAGVAATVEHPLADIPLHDTAVCSGALVYLTAGNPGAHYVWNTGDTTEVIETVDSGLYRVLITSEFGCTNTDSIRINWRPYADVNGFDFIPSFYPELGTVSFAPIDPVAVEYYLWDFGDGTQDTMITPVHTYSNTGDFLVSLTVSNSCGDFTVSQMIHADLTTGIVTTAGEKEAGFVLFPNPARNIITIKARSANTFMTNFQIYDMLGRRVYVSYSETGVAEKQISLDGLASGLYSIKVKTKEGSIIVRKFELAY